MVEKHKKVSWTPIIIIVVVLVFLLVIIFGFNSNESFSNDSNEKLKDSQIIPYDLVGSSKIQTINNPNETVSIKLTGSSNQINVTKETQILNIKIMGNSNIINLCKVHSPKIDDVGSDNIINYSSC